MIHAVLLLLTVTAATPTPSFQAAFPTASVVESPAGGRLVLASGFSAPGLGATPEAAARAFLQRYGAAFGLTAREELVLRRTVGVGRPGVVTFERRIDGAPLFDGDLLVGLDGAGAVILVNVADVPPQVIGRAAISRAAAVRAARGGFAELLGDGPAEAELGWRAVGGVIRPVWRVDFIAIEPAGDWRIYVDAETREVLLRSTRPLTLVSSR